MEITVKSKYIRTSPRKIRLLTNLVKGMFVSEALAQLKYSNKQTAAPVIHLVNSAAAAAKEKGWEVDNLYIKLFICNQGPALKRMKYLPRGRSSMIKKRSAHITLVVDLKTQQKSVNADKTKKQQDKKAAVIDKSIKPAKTQSKVKKSKNK